MPPRLCPWDTSTLELMCPSLILIRLTFGKKQHEELEHMRPTFCRQSGSVSAFLESRGRDSDVQCPASPVGSAALLCVVFADSVLW